MALAVETGFVASEDEYYDALGVATRTAAREAAIERERADDTVSPRGARDVDLDAETLVVLGKNQADEEAPFPPQACGPLEQLH